MNGPAPTPHPSYLELDRLALGAAGATATATHVAGCDRCRRHVDGLGYAPPLPDALRSRLAAGRVGRFVERWLPGRRGWFFGATGLVGAAALAAAVLWFGGRPDGTGAPAPGYLGSKGLPSVWIYVKRENELMLWDGQRPLAAGDRLRLKVNPQDMTHVDVFTREETGAGAGPLKPVFSGRVPRGAVTTLPSAWQLDGTGRRESLIVVLSNRAVSAADAKRFVEAGAPPGVWLRRFELRSTPPAPEPEPSR